jgi:16S rRNA processing protein RimM
MDGVLEVGRVVKAHGVEGDVVVELVTNRHERLAPGGTLDVEGGRRLAVAGARPVPGGRHGSRFIVSFAGVGSRNAAEALRGARLYAAAMEDTGSWWVHELVGARLLAASGAEVGTVVAVEANPASDLLVLDGGALVPLRFVTEKGDGWLKAELPSGLLEL